MLARLTVSIGGIYRSAAGKRGRLLVLQRILLKKVVYQSVLGSSQGV